MQRRSQRHAPSLFVSTFLETIFTFVTRYQWKSASTRFLRIKKDLRSGLYTVNDDRSNDEKRNKLNFRRRHFSDIFKISI
ncbi:unnamed protein product [Thlaspi arvense]|uniref:Secreted protein n=1 Tax=Thlaspi arvense TaxID=13288 RepID=A0AAU9SR10_THLAR|nr:unnamed protein product [Thlaspi arvense]